MYNTPSLQLVSQLFGLATIAQSTIQFYLFATIATITEILLNHCNLQPKIATCKISPAICNGFLFPALRDKLHGKLHRETLALDVFTAVSQ